MRQTNVAQKKSPEAVVDVRLRRGSIAVNALREQRVSPVLWRLSDSRARRDMLFMYKR